MKSPLPIVEVVKKGRSASSGPCPFWGKQRNYIHFHGFGQDDQFTVRDAAELGFDFGKRSAAQFQSENRATGSEQRLSHRLLITQFPELRPHDIPQEFLFLRHAPKMELDTITTEELDCSSFGAKCRPADLAVSPQMRLILPWWDLEQSIWKNYQHS